MSIEPTLLDRETGLKLTFTVFREAHRRLYPRDTEESVRADWVRHQGLYPRLFIYVDDYQVPANEWGEIGL